MSSVLVGGVAVIVVAILVVSALVVLLRRRRGPLLQRAVYTPFKVVATKHITDNTVLVTFATGSSQGLGLPVGKHVSIKFDFPEGPQKRPYTPITPTSSDVFSILVKRYEDGCVSKRIHDLQVGAWVDMCGPTGAFSYTDNMYKSIIMLAGGTGITPMLQILDYALNEPKDSTRFSLFFYNSSPEDILLYEVIENLSKKFPERLQVTFVVSKAHKAHRWTGIVGRVSADHVTKVVGEADWLDGPPAAFVCGPPGFVEAATNAVRSAGCTTIKCL